MAQNIETKTIRITTTGSPGSAVGSGTITDIYGFLLDVRIDWHASAPVTSIATLSDPVFGNLLVTPAGNVDTTFTPRKEICDPTGAGAGLYDFFPMDGSLNVAVSACNALTDALVCTIRYFRG